MQQQVPQTNFLKPHTVTVASMMHIVLFAPVFMCVDCVQGVFRTHHWWISCLQTGLPIHGSSKTHWL